MRLLSTDIAQARAPLGLEKATVAEDVESWMSRHHFALRRLHSLTGIIPIGAFLVEHMLTNSLAWFGAGKFNAQVHWLHELHYLIWLEILFIFAPLAFHGIYGLVIALTARHNVTQYPYADNWRFFLQRWTGIIAILFVLVHLGHFRFAHWFGGTAYVGCANPFVLTVSGFANIPPGTLWFPIYIIGLLAAVYHFCNGLVTFCITWGIAISVASRKRLTVVAAGVGAVLIVWGAMSLYALARAKATVPDELAPPEGTRLVQQQIPASDRGS
jgi:succinate dehydrogenase / fumarate reductase cytochrome b subunit